jgi:hypothetical protein
MFLVAAFYPWLMRAQLVVHSIFEYLNVAYQILKNPRTLNEISMSIEILQHVFPCRSELKTADKVDM